MATILERLSDALGSQNAVARALDVHDSYPTRWKKLGYIPEQWALAVHRLNVSDSTGRITGRDVLIEAENTRALGRSNVYAA